MMYQRYPTDLTDGQWKLVAPLLPAAKPGGRPRSVYLCAVLNGIFYVTRGGVPWRMLPHDLPPWGTVHYYYGAGGWTAPGKILKVLRARLRHADGRKRVPRPRSSTPRRFVLPREAKRGFDAGKRTPGRKRHIIVDTMGLLLAVVVHSASLQDRDGVKRVGERVKGQFPRFKLIWADVAYEAAVGGAKQFGNWVLELVRKPAVPKGSWSRKGAGSWSGRSPGWSAAAGWPATTKGGRKLVLKQA